MNRVERKKAKSRTKIARRETFILNSKVDSVYHLQNIFNFIIFAECKGSLDVCNNIIHFEFIARLVNNNKARLNYCKVRTKLTLELELLQFLLMYSIRLKALDITA